MHFASEKLFFQKKNWLTLIQSYIFPVTMDNRIIWNKISDHITTAVTHNSSVD